MSRGTPPDGEDDNMVRCADRCESCIGARRGCIRHQGQVMARLREFDCSAVFVDRNMHWLGVPSHLR
jgi:hypothetical protein